MNAPSLLEVHGMEMSQDLGLFRPPGGIIGRGWSHMFAMSNQYRCCKTNLEE